MKRLVLIAALALAGCATTGETITVKVPVPVACVSDQLPKTPTYPDTLAALKAAPDQAEFTRLLAAGWPLRNARLEALEAAVEACRTP
jgi:hypothetical protein